MPTMKPAMCASTVIFRFMAMQEFESAIAQLLIALPSMVIIVSSQDHMSFSSPHITSKSLELQPLATEDAERMIRQQVAKQTPQAVVTELAALCGNIPIALSVVSRSIPDTEPSAAQVPPSHIMHVCISYCEWANAPQCHKRADDAL